MGDEFVKIDNNKVIFFLNISNSEQWISIFNTNIKQTAVDTEPTESIEELRKEFTDYKLSTEKRLETLEKQNEVNQFKTFKDVIAEFKAFVTTNGYSKLLGTNCFFKKMLWLIFVVPLFAYCMFVVYESLYDFYQFHVVTQVLVKDEEAMVFPAITFCIKAFTTDQISMIGGNFSRAFHSCIFINETSHACSLDDFEKTSIFAVDHNGTCLLECYKFNGGRNPISTSRFGAYSGLRIQFNISENEFLSYYVSDNAFQPTSAEMMSINQPHEIVLVSIRKTVDIKLPWPYNNCTQCKSVSYGIDENVYNPYQGWDNVLKMNFFLAENKYTEISQLVKTTGADLISSTGGVLGLFLELSFISSYRFLIFLFEVAFQGAC